ncbi:MAG TPA: MMPL family transporter [Solirubrobacteraceae bacterium]|nr:MMPL family transporter [Solirubrobacteraceae bacterium]
MFRRIITFITHHPKSFIALWAVAALVLGSVGNQNLYKVTTDDTAQYLPKSSESAQAIKYAQSAFGQVKGAHAVTMLVKRPDGRALTTADRVQVRALAGALPDWRVGKASDRAGRVLAAQAGPTAPDGRFQLVGLQWQAHPTDPIAQEHFRDVRDRAVSEARAHDLRVGFTGSIATAADNAKASEHTQGLSQLLLMGAVVVLSLVFFRGPLAAVIPLVTIMFLTGAANGVVVMAAQTFGFKLDTSTPDLITVVLIGIGVDYFLFLLFRLRERLRAGEDRRTAAANAAASVSPVIASAALAIAAAFATMLLADFGQFRVLGPSVAISILVMLLAGVTLMPAVAAVTGRALFWPSRSWAKERTNGPAARLGRTIARTPGRTALAVVAVLVLLSSFAIGTKMSYDMGSGPSTAATRTADEISATLSKGASDPLHVYVKSDTGKLTAAELAPMRARLAATHSVSGVAQPVMSADGRGAEIDVALKAAPMTKAAMDAVRGPVRDAVRTTAPAGAETMVGGTSAVYADVGDAVNRDMHVIFPVAMALLMLILVVALRSAVAPLYLLAAVVLEFTATLGASVLVFQQLGGHDGLAFILPLTLFLFVAALGTDYNILMTARLREEMLAGRPVREAVAEAVRHVAPAIGAAGLVLASSFGTLMLEADSASHEQGFAITLGILLASLVVSTILVPAITALAGRRAWWPGRAAGERKAPARAKGVAPQPAG